MNVKNHETIHSLVPVYAALSRIKQLSVEGWASGSPISLTNTQLRMLFEDLQREADDGMGHLMAIEHKLTRRNENVG